MAEESIQRTEAEATFETYRHYLHREASSASSYFRLYRRLWERRNDHLDDLNVAPAFFTIATDALYSVTIIWVDKLLDERGERGLFNFLSFVENNRKMLAISELQRRKSYPDGHWMLKREPITYETVETDRTRLRELACLPAVKLRRDKFHAHFDKDYFFDRTRFAAEAELKWEEFEQAFSTILEIINGYSAAYDGQLFSLTPINITDLDHLLRLVKRAREKRL